MPDAIRQQESLLRTHVGRIADLEEQKSALKATIKADQVLLSQSEGGSQEWDSLVTKIRGSSRESDQIDGEIAELSTTISSLRADIQTEQRACI